MTLRTDPSVSISLDDLTLVSEAVMHRATHRAVEQHRVARIRELLGAASRLGRALSVHTHHALVNCQGTHGIGDPVSDAVALHDVFAAYAAVLRDVAAECRPIVRPGPRPAPREHEADATTAEATAA
jgi:hypothetical protein